MPGDKNRKEVVRNEKEVGHESSLRLSFHSNSGYSVASQKEKLLSVFSTVEMKMKTESLGVR